MSGAMRPTPTAGLSGDSPQALVIGPPRFVIERDADGALLAVWSNPPPSVAPFDAVELREIAVALFDMARFIDAERALGPPTARHARTVVERSAAQDEARDRSRGVH